MAGMVYISYSVELLSSGAVLVPEDVIERDDTIRMKCLRLC